MRNLLLLCFTFCAISLIGQNINLKMPAAFYYSKSPAQGKRIKYTVTTKLEGINLITTDNQQSKRLGKNSINSSNGLGRPSKLLAIPKLYSIAFGNDGVKTFSFGRNGGEDGVDDATVKLTYNSAATVSTPLNENNQPIIFKVTKAEIHKAEKSHDNHAISNKEDFLEVEASPQNPATLTINRNSKQGNTIVAIFDEKNGKLLGTLNPKDPDNPAPTLSFTTDKTVCVIPVIRPKVTSANGKDIIIFEVGDPEENGHVEAEDE